MTPAPVTRARASVRGTVVALLTLLLMTVGGIAPATAATGSVTYDVRVLVIDDGSPMVAAITDRLTAEGQPFDRIDLTSPDRPVITAATLATEHRRGIDARYSGLVTPNEAPSGLSEDERAVLAAYAATFKVREVSAYTWAHPEVGLNYAANPGYVGPVDGMSATLTPEALSGPFAYLDGPVELDDLDPTVDESWGYLATPLPATETSAFTPLLTAPIPGSDARGSLVGVHSLNGMERMVITFGSNQHQQHWKVLSHGIVTWLTRGVSLTYQRYWFSAHIDDVFMSSAMWSPEGDCTIGDGCDPTAYPEDAPGATIRMTADDAAHLVDWQRASGIKLDMTYNAVGTVEERRRAGSDELERALLARKGELRWISHTYSHPYLGCVQDHSTVPWTCATDSRGRIQYMSRWDIGQEIWQNRFYAWNNRLPNQADNVLVTGQHSGLRSLPQMTQDSPHLSGALWDTSIRWIAADASREKEIRQIGPATTVPRYPMNVFYNNAYRDQAVDEYNWIYTSRADRGSGTCEDNPETTTCIEPLDPATGYDSYIVPLESRIALGHVLANDPRPHFVHQANLTGDRLLYPVIDTMNATYRNLFADNAPLLNPTMQQAGAELVRQADWRAQQGRVDATISGGTLTVRNTGSRTIEAPVTVPEGSRTAGWFGRSFGDPYAGQRSGSTRVLPWASIRVDLGTDPGLATNATWPPVPSVADDLVLTPQPDVERKRPTTIIELLEAITRWYTDW